MGYFAPDSQAVGGRYKSLNPTRVFDSRSPGNIPVGNSGPIYLDVPVGDSTNVTALVLNVTAVNAQAGGYLGVFPGNVPPAHTSNLNFGPGDTVPNLVMVGAAPFSPTTSRIGIEVGGLTDVVVDLVGTFTTDRSTGAGRFVPIDPSRIVDTRTMPLGGPLTTDRSIHLPMIGQIRPNMAADYKLYPVETTGLVFNATGANATAATYLSFWPGDQNRPWASNLNLNAGDTRANLVLMGSDGYGFTNGYNAQGSVDLIADAAGWFTR
jgi:hypothetical protein